MLELKDVRYEYQGGIVALDDFSLKIQDGEFLAVLGHNGSGKSTLGKLLDALLLPTKGKVLVDELDTASPPHLQEIRKRVGMVFQNPDDQMVASIVQEDVAFGPENLGLPPQEIRERVQEALRKVGIGDLALAPVSSLSGGEKQKVAIAGAIAMKPRYLVLDEPCSMLDSPGRRDVVRVVRELNSSYHVTIVYLAHQIDEVRDAHRVVVLREGKKRLEGIPGKVFRQEEILASLGIEPPPISVLATCLEKGGISLPPSTLTVGEVASFLLDERKSSALRTFQSDE